MIYKATEYSNNKYCILPNTRASPNRRAPLKFFDHVGLPEDSSSKIYMIT